MSLDPVTFLTTWWATSTSEPNPEALLRLYKNNKKEFLFRILSTIWSPEPNLARSFRQATTPPILDKLVQTLDQLLSLMASKDSRGVLSEFFFNDSSFLILQKFLESKTIASTGDLKSVEESLDSLDLEALNIRKSALIEKNNEIAFDIFALRIFQEWRLIACKYPLQIMQINKELLDVQNKIKSFQDLALATSFTKERRDSFLQLLEQFRNTHQKLTALEGNVYVSHAKQDFFGFDKRITEEFLDDLRFIDKSLVHQQPSFMATLEKLKQIKQQGVFLYDYLLHIFEVELPQIICRGIRLEQEFLELNFAFELQIPLNNIRELSGTNKVGLTTACKTLGAEPSLEQMDYVYGQALSPFKKLVEGLQICKTNAFWLSAPQDYYIETLIKRLNSLSKDKEEISALVKDCVERIQAKQQHFKESVIQNLQTIETNLKTTAWQSYGDDSYATLDYLESLIAWKKAGSGRLNWALQGGGYAAGVASNYLAPVLLPSNITSQSDKTFEDMLLNIPDFFSVEKADEVKAAQEEPVRVLVSENGDLLRAMTNFHRDLSQVKPSHPFFIFSSVDFPSKEQLAGFWDIDFPKTLDLDFLVSKYKEQKKNAEFFIDQSNLFINLYNVAQHLRHSLQQADEFVTHEIIKLPGDLKEMLDITQKFLATLDPFVHCELAVADESAKVATSFQALVFPPLLSYDSAVFNKEKEYLEKLKFSTFTFGKKPLPSFIGFPEPSVGLLGKKTQLLESLHECILKEARATLPTVFRTHFSYLRIHYICSLIYPLNRHLSVSSVLSKQSSPLKEANRTKIIAKQMKKKNVQEQKLNLEEVSKQHSTLINLFQESLETFANLAQNLDRSQAMFYRDFTALLTEIDFQKDLIQLEALPLSQEIKETRDELENKYKFIHSLIKKHFLNVAVDLDKVAERREIPSASCKEIYEKAFFEKTLYM